MLFYRHFKSLSDIYKKKKRNKNKRIKYSHRPKTTHQTNTISNGVQYLVSGQFVFMSRNLSNTDYKLSSHLPSTRLNSSCQQIYEFMICSPWNSENKMNYSQSIIDRNFNRSIWRYYLNQLIHSKRFTQIVQQFRIGSSEWMALKIELSSW